MHSSTSTLAVILVLASLSANVSQGKPRPCSDEFSDMAAQKHLSTNCKKLSTLEAEFAWNHRNNGTDRKKIELEVFVGTKNVTEMGWLAWGVNPERPRMVGTRAIIGIMMPNGTQAIKTYNITADTRRGCALRPSDVDVKFQDMAVEYNNSAGYFSIFSRVMLPVIYYNISRLNHVWQVGQYVNGLEPQMHSMTLQNFDSKETVNLTSADGRGKGVGHSRRRLRKVHGILNIIGWGTLLPIGVIIARYFRKYPFKSSWWFLLHVSCQTAGFVLGTIGFATGLWIGHYSRFYSFHTHRTLAICIFAFTTLQLLAFRLKPTPDDEYRKHWNVYHHFLGYALIAIISVNIFHGIDILKPHKFRWRWTFIGILVALATVTLALEIYTWITFLAAKKRAKNDRKSKPTSSSSSR
ncbi:hypothetical protein SLEP1_g47347 [Rubroshorea leprosula]|uniref:Cytochrome b561 and DOMON domain-containing protein n=1 Tax=Rubroshorea leprosula TaxID=152421 RepID=A0AAV5LSC8_9ROSI|nr:hypothetical protein SLEP1_g47347 [Rubroshorea leprosula]